MWSFNSAKLIRLSLIILIVAKTSGNAFVNNKVAQILLKASWNTACRGGGWTVNIILLDPATSMRSVLAGQECRTGPRATDGWMGGALLWLPSYDITMPSPVVMLPEKDLSATNGWMGVALLWLPSCNVATPSPAVMLPENGPSATDGWIGGALLWLPSCNVTTSSPIVMLPEPAVAETKGGSELYHTGCYKTSYKVYE